MAIIYVTSKLSSHDMSLIEKELAIQLCVRGYHVYIDIWLAAVGKSYHVNMSLGTLAAHSKLFLASN